MAKDIERLLAGQAPSLLNTTKGNELIDAINTLRTSRSSMSAESAGIILRVSSEGRIELDVTSDLLEQLNPQNDEQEEQAPGAIPEGYAEATFVVTVNGIATVRTFLIKS